VNTPLEAGSAPLPRPYFHEPSGAVRFWVALHDAPPMGAILSKEVLRYRFDAAADGRDAVAAYESHRDEIDAAVLLRVSRGSIEPVLLRENDLPAKPRPPYRPMAA
jgi:hypothetical protein